MVDDNPNLRGAHWRRYRRLMATMLGLAVVAVGGALVVLTHEGVVLRPNFVIALALGIGVSLLLAGALMGLVFVSANSGHDDSVERPLDKPDDRPRSPWERRS